MKETVVLLPWVGVGHLIPMVELAKLFLCHGFSVAILLVDHPFHTSSTTATFISRVSSAHSISFHHLPAVSLGPRCSFNPQVIFDLLRLSNPHILDFLKSFSQTSAVHALVLDFFCTDALDISAQLHIPSYFFFTTSASNLSAALFLPAVYSEFTASLEDPGDTPLHFPGLPPIPVSDMPSPLQNREDEANEAFLFHFERLPKGDAFIVNTFESLEKMAVQALVDGLCLPGRPMPPVYCIGPLIAEGGGGEKHECLAWLDTQLRGSVVFLCFGSMGMFSVEQLKEIATGLERSGQKFLWAVRSPQSENRDPEALLPEGFLERTQGRGMVVKSWAPQVAVLNHDSVGGFVTHCGWNSVLEAVSGGVPMIAWPLYAEQRMNKVFLVETAKLAVEMSGYDKDLVSAEEVEARIRWLMELEGGRELRDRAAAAKECAVAARKEGGSSYTAWMELASVLKKGDLSGDNIQ